MKKIIFSLLVLCASIMELYAQKDLQITMFAYGESVFNPSLTANDRAIDATLLARQQWFNFDRAPQTQFLSFEAPLKQHSGLGFAVMHDKLGYENNYDITLNYAYYFNLRNHKRIGLGIGGNLLSKNLEGSQLIYEETYDPNGVYSDETHYNMNMNFGLSFSTPKLNIGLSTRHIVASELSSTTIFNTARHYYFYSGFTLNINEHLSFQPTVLVKTNLQLWEYNAGMVAEFENTLRFGFNYRYKESTSLILGLILMKNFQVMYSYDIITGTLYNISPASHEIVLRFLKKPKPPKLPYLKSPRYFN